VDLRFVESYVKSLQSLFVYFFPVVFGLYPTALDEPPGVARAGTVRPTTAALLQSGFSGREGELPQTPNSLKCKGKPGGAGGFEPPTCGLGQLEVGHLALKDLFGLGKIA